MTNACLHDQDASATTMIEHRLHAKRHAQETPFFFFIFDGDSELRSKPTLANPTLAIVIQPTLANVFFLFGFFVSIVWIFFQLFFFCFSVVWIFCVDCLDFFNCFL